MPYEMMVRISVLFCRLYVFYNIRPNSSELYLSYRLVQNPLEWKACWAATFGLRGGDWWRRRRLTRVLSEHSVSVKVEPHNWG